MHPGNSYDTTALLTEISEKSGRDGKTFLELSLSDGKSKITARKWDSKAGDLGFGRMSVVDLHLKVTEYNGAASFVADRLDLSGDTSLKVEDFIVKVPYDIEAMFSQLISLIEKSAEGDFEYAEGENTISELTVNILTESKERYCSWSAAKQLHHALYGGLLYHSYRMAYAAYLLKKIYKLADRELLICGAALHDVGKIYELSSDYGTADYTNTGKKLGHAYIGMRMIEKEAEKGSYPEDRIEDLLHLIASHHRYGEFGAITYPISLEADLLHIIDEMDARMYQYEDNLQKTTPGEFSQNKLYGLDNHSIYRPAYLTDELILKRLKK